MFILFGLRTTIHPLGTLRSACRVCGTVAAQMLSERVTRFSLFFVPLFRLRTRYAAQCTACGATYGLSRQEATRSAIL
ncbi:zinc-ribbon domain-containing protein [Sphaerisporangium sp. NPDC005288]|uniref:Zinc-ribbon domain-containing protein n=1 Tax=Sphaerisporangium rhizosphaerae TaxID=2269375 RepID=A0ABW2PCA8_9ACTN